MSRLKKQRDFTLLLAGPWCLWAWNVCIRHSKRSFARRAEPAWRRSGRGSSLLLRV